MITTTTTTTRKHWQMPVQFVWLWFLLFVISAGISTADEPQAGHESECVAVGNENDDDPMMTSSKLGRLQAAQRLIQASFSGMVLSYKKDNQNSNVDDSSLISSWLEDWALVLQGTDLHSLLLKEEKKDGSDDNATAAEKEGTKKETLQRWIWNQRQTEQEQEQQKQGETEEKEEEEPTTTDTNTTTTDNNTPNMDNRFSPHRHVQGILHVHDNYDCLEQEFDAQDLDLDEARRVLLQCRILVLRNLYSNRTTQTTLGQNYYKHYVQGVHAKLQQQQQQQNRHGNDNHDNNIISGTTSHGGGGSFILQEDVGRANYMIPQDLVQSTPDVWGNPLILELLRHPLVLDQDMVVNHMGSVNAEPNAPTQYWHADGNYVHGGNHHDHEEGSFRETGVAGHDLPPFAINMFTPLAPHNLTMEHGPTEFCLGTSHLRGHNLQDDYALLPHLLEQEAPPHSHTSSTTTTSTPTNNNIMTQDQTDIVDALHDFEYRVLYGPRRKRQPHCPKGFRRTPLLQTGDVLLFDYMVTHRGGPNLSTDLRAMLFTMYSRKWYRDSTFDGDYSQQWPYYHENENENKNNGNADDMDKEEQQWAQDEEYQDELARLTHMTRYAVLGEPTDGTLW